jgi:ribosomal protein S18 acetylase RimI-like enzyme
VTTLEIVEVGGAGEFESVRERAQPGAPAEGVPEGMARLVARRGAVPVARCTLGVADELHGAAGRSGLVGHYEAIDAAAGAELLATARERLAGLGVARVLGPLNGSTWARYRLALGDENAIRNDPDWFLGEPRNPFDYPSHFETAGFSVAARYESRVDADLDDAEPAPPPPGVTVAPLDLARFDHELASLFAFSTVAFADNLYYAPIPFALFRAAYDQLRPILDPELVLLAHSNDGRLSGFLLAYADPLRAARGGPPRLVVKTVATAPALRGKGLGNHLLDRVRATARARGFQDIVHALMHVENFSMRMSVRHGSRVFRRYALYGWAP